MFPFLLPLGLKGRKDNLVSYDFILKVEQFSGIHFPFGVVVIIDFNAVRILPSIVIVGL